MAVIISLCMSAVIVHSRKINNKDLQDSIAQQYPVSAVHVVKIHNYQGPLFNHYNWGGFLIWQLPMIPVSMDGRANLHGVDAVQRSSNTWAGKHDWFDDKTLEASQLVIAGRDSPLTSLLKMDVRFENVYEDNLSDIFIRR